MKPLAKMLFGQTYELTAEKICRGINGIIHTYKKGDRYFIPKGVKHAGKIYAGYAGIVFFDQSDRYKSKPL